ncbi:hypothetical protein [Paenibacillus harenae]|uniref:hypothetical protein n=1 Tax=Paenibacillus harenae TaxID=306543 RepID=UPI0003FD7A5C|nr:hypothetical protein [Paenibacillus harenae]
MKHVHKKEAATTVAASVSSIIFSIIAASHHWLHMLILLVLGSSTNIMVGMPEMNWLRKAMILATFITALYSIYRLIKHKHMPAWMKGMTYVSVLTSLGFSIYTLYRFGW